jgi:hypothetical protein
VFSCPSGFSRPRNNTNKSNGTGTGNTRTTGTAKDNIIGFSVWHDRHSGENPAHTPLAGCCRFRQAERLPGVFRGLTVRNTAEPTGKKSGGRTRLVIHQQA